MSYLRALLRRLLTGEPIDPMIICRTFGHKRQTELVEINWDLWAMDYLPGPCLRGCGTYLQGDSIWDPWINDGGREAKG